MSEIAVCSLAWLSSHWGGKLEVTWPAGHCVMWPKTHTITWPTRTIDHPTCFLMSYDWLSLLTLVKLLRKYHAHWWMKHAHVNRDHDRVLHMHRCVLTTHRTRGAAKTSCLSFLYLNMLSFCSFPRSCWFLSPRSRSSPPPFPPSHHRCSGPVLSLVGRIQATRACRHTHSASGSALKILLTRLLSKPGAYIQTHTPLQPIQAHTAELSDSPSTPTQPCTPTCSWSIHRLNGDCDVFQGYYRAAVQVLLKDVFLDDIYLENHPSRLLKSRRQKQNAHPASN